MKPNKHLIAAICMVIALAFFAGWAVSAEEVTIVATVNDDYQIVTDSKPIYDIGETDAGDEVGRLTGKKVEVRGTVEPSEGKNVIMVNSFKVLEQ